MSLDAMQVGLRSIKTLITTLGVAGKLAAHREIYGRGESMSGCNLSAKVIIKYSNYKHQI